MAVSDAMCTRSMLISGSINLTLCHTQRRRINVDNFHVTVRQVLFWFKPEVLNLWVAIVFYNELKFAPTQADGTCVCQLHIAAPATILIDFLLRTNTN
jgi:hypothetical protein